eukprot:GDKH01005718.1.p2 GENE.GDKH01005718.1~~GDKH01005718.1.p2  ORF type:complete len:54 (-),score=15.94 GDKH01005718.1:194-355(-)
MMDCEVKQQQCKTCCDGSAVYSDCKKDLGADACKNDCDFALTSCENNASQWGL